MALVMKGAAMGAMEIIALVKRSFEFYRNTDSTLFDRLYGLLYSRFAMFEGPATKNFDWGSWQVCDGEARVYLEHTLCQERSGTFPFLDLPAELRNKIYDMVLQYPVSGILLAPHEPQTFYTTTKDLSTPFSTEKSVHQLRWRLSKLYEQPIQKSLSLLLVNKQTFTEAFPSFYRNNVFHFRTTQHAYEVLQRMPSYRRQHISQLAVHYDPDDPATASRLCSYFTSMPKLQKLYLYIEESRWLRRRTASTSTVDILQAPATASLRKVRIQEVVFMGNCPIIAANLKAEMESGGPKKRKKCDGEVVARRQYGRAAKRSKQ